MHPNIERLMLKTSLKWDVHPFARLNGVEVVVDGPVEVPAAVGVLEKVQIQAAASHALQLEAPIHRH